MVLSETNDTVLIHTWIFVDLRLHSIVIGIHKYNVIDDRNVILKEDFLPLSYFQQWVLFKLYFSKKYDYTKAISTEDLIMNACMSVAVDGFDEQVANDNLKDLSTKKLIELAENGEWAITLNGSILVKGATSKIHELLDNPDFDAIMEQITRKTVKVNLLLLRDDEDYSDVNGMVRKIMELFISHIKDWSSMISLLIDKIGL